MDGAPVATGTVRRRDPPLDDYTAGWQIRGMAVEPSMRNRGYGSAILEAILDHVEKSGGGLVWCHARELSVPLYRRAGFIPLGEPFVDDIAGEQILMTLHVGAA